MKNLFVLSSRKSSRDGAFPIFLICLTIAIFPIISCATSHQKPVDPAIASGELSKDAAEPTQPEDQSVEIEQKWGVKILGIRQTANSSLLDFRFHVIDPEKANPLIGRHAKPYIIDEASGMKLSVPSMPKVGSLRAKGNQPDRDYFILFSNPNGIVKKGNKVTVIADDFKVEHLVVE
ncbi:MAG: hypothetical protein ACXWM6_07410 [Thermodesulfobacteriota bacterium]